MNRLAAAMLFVAIGSGLAYCGGVMETVSLEKVSFNGIKKLRVDASLFGVEITGSNRDSVDMEVRMPRELLERYEVQHAQEGSALVVRVVQKKIGLLGFHGELRVVFQVPRAIDLDITTASGDQVVRAMACRNATLRSSSGDIDARDIEAGFQAASSSGSIVLKTAAWIASSLEFNPTLKKLRLSREPRRRKSFASEAMSSEFVAIAPPSPKQGRFLLGKKLKVPALPIEPAFLPFKVAPVA